MNWDRLKAGLIRGFWTFVFPMIGAVVIWLANDQNLQDIGIEDATVASLIAAVLYGLKKVIWPDTVL